MRVGVRETLDVQIATAEAVTKSVVLHSGDLRRLERIMHARDSAVHHGMVR